MDFLQQKAKIEREIVGILLDKIDAGEMTTEESIQVVNYCIEKIKPLNTKEELTAFLAEIFTKWPMFQNIKTQEDAEKKENEKDIAVDKVIALTRNGQLNEALSVAKTATNN